MKKLINIKKIAVKNNGLIRDAIIGYNSGTSFTGVEIIEGSDSIQREIYFSKGEVVAISEVGKANEFELISAKSKFDVISDELFAEVRAQVALSTQIRYKNAFKEAQMYIDEEVQLVANNLDYQGGDYYA